MEPQKIVIKPYRNSFEPVLEYKNTTITLLEDRLEYFINYKYSTKVQLEEPDLITGEKFGDEDCILFDTGFMTKEGITGVSLYAEDYGRINNEEVNELSYIIGIISNNIVNIRVENKKEGNKIYKQIYNWKFNIIENE